MDTDLHTAQQLRLKWTLATRIKVPLRPLALTLEPTTMLDDWSVGQLHDLSVPSS